MLATLLSTCFYKQTGSGWVQSTGPLLVGQRSMSHIVGTSHATGFRDDGEGFGITGSFGTDCTAGSAVDGRGAGSTGSEPPGLRNASA